MRTKIVHALIYTSGLLSGMAFADHLFIRSYLIEAGLVTLVIAWLLRETGNGG